MPAADRKPDDRRPAAMAATAEAEGDAAGCDRTAEHAERSELSMSCRAFRAARSAQAKGGSGHDRATSRVGEPPERDRVARGCDGPESERAAMREKKRDAGDGAAAW